LSLDLGLTMGTNLCV